jgi:hypothetical protein
VPHKATRNEGLHNEAWHKNSQKRTWRGKRVHHFSRTIVLYWPFHLWPLFDFYFFCYMRYRWKPSLILFPVNMLTLPNMFMSLHFHFVLEQREWRQVKKTCLTIYFPLNWIFKKVPFPSLSQIAVTSLKCLWIKYFSFSH